MSDSTRWTSARLLELVNRVVALVFLAAAVLQYNDPDPLSWGALYGLAAAACLTARLERLGWLLPLVTGSAAVIWAGVEAPRVLPALAWRDLFRTMKAESPSIEASRELLGLLLVAGWMTLLLVRRRAERARPE